MRLFSKIPTQSVDDLTRLLHPEMPNKEWTEMRQAFFPAEWFPQSMVQLTWPHAATDWASCLQEVTKCYVRMAYEIASEEILLIVTPEPENIRHLLAEKLPQRLTENIVYLQCDTNDTWARDHAFLCVITGGKPMLLDFCFNGWGGKYEATLDNAINRQLFDSGLLQGEYVDCMDFVLEGGSMESDGKGTVMTTAQCLLSPKRNPHMNRAMIEEHLLRLLRAQRIIWLEHGHLEGDDTDGHIDTLARFCPGDTIAYVQCTNKNDIHFEELQLMEEELKALHTLEGNPYRLLPLPMPETVWHEDERLPATYANFLVINNKVLMPTYGQPQNDACACAVLQQAFPRREVVGIDCRILLRQHGSLHCCTMQYPIGTFNLQQS